MNVEPPYPLPYPQKLSDRTGFAQNLGLRWSGDRPSLGRGTKVQSAGVLGQASGEETSFKQRACWRRLAASNVSNSDGDGDVVSSENCTCMLQTCWPAHCCVQSQVWPMQTEDAGPGVLWCGSTQIL
jgi:hypothetical protein